MTNEITSRDRIDALIARFPYQFASKHLGINVSYGWVGIFEQLCTDIDALLGDDKRGFHWVQCKEKHGGACFYYETEKATMGVRISAFMPGGKVVVSRTPAEPADGSDVLRRLDKLVADAEERSEQFCYACGEPGRMWTTRWYLTLCDTHGRLHRDDRDEFIEELSARNGPYRE